MDGVCELDNNSSFGTWGLKPKQSNLKRDLVMRRTITLDYSFQNFCCCLNYLIRPLDKSVE